MQLEQACSRVGSCQDTASIDTWNCTQPAAKCACHEAANVAPHHDQCLCLTRTTASDNTWTQKATTAMPFPLCPLGEARWTHIKPGTISPTQQDPNAIRNTPCSTCAVLLVQTVVSSMLLPGPRALPLAPEQVLEGGRPALGPMRIHCIHGGQHSGLFWAR